MLIITINIFGSLPCSFFKTDAENNVLKSVKAISSETARFEFVEIFTNSRFSEKFIFRTKWNKNETNFLLQATMANNHLFCLSSEHLPCEWSEDQLLIHTLFPLDILQTLCGDTNTTIVRGYPLKTFINLQNSAQKITSNFKKWKYPLSQGSPMSNLKNKCNSETGQNYNKWLFSTKHGTKA